MEVDLGSKNLETAEALRTRLEASQLHISEARSKYLSLLEGTGESRVLDRFGPPSVLEADASHQTEHLRKLKLLYREEYSKDKYVKIIVNDDPPEITAMDNERLEAANLSKKSALKDKKVKLAEKWTDVKRLAPLVEQDHQKAKALTDDIVVLARDNFEARLALSRLRQAYPQPRYTVATAEEKLASQVTEMQQAEEELQRKTHRASDAKSALKATVKEVDRLRTLKAELERRLEEQLRDEEADEEADGLYEWFTRAHALHKSLFQMESFHLVAENELRITYNAEPSATQKKAHPITLDLIFVPNSRRLAGVQVEGLNGADVEALTSPYIHANDVPGLIWAVISRARGAGSRYSLN